MTPVTFLVSQSLESLSNDVLILSSESNQNNIPPSLLKMLTESSSRFLRSLLRSEVSRTCPSPSLAQSSLMSLDKVVRLVADCAPPHYFYFIQIQSGYWDQDSVREGREYFQTISFNG